MCQTEPSRSFNLMHATAMMKSALIGAGILMVALGIVGLTVALTAGGRLGDARTAYGAGLTALTIASVMVIAVGALMVNLTVLRHQRSIERNLAKQIDARSHQITTAQAELPELRDLVQGIARGFDKRLGTLAEQITEAVRGFDGRLDEIGNEHDRLEHLLTTVFHNQEREAAVISDVLEGKVRALHVRGN
jgi:hypothetical protein